MAIKTFLQLFQGHFLWDFYVPPKSGTFTIKTVKIKNHPKKGENLLLSKYMINKDKYL